MPNIARLAFLVAMIIAGTALVAGCGDDESPSATSNGEASSQGNRDGGEEADRDSPKDRDSGKGGDEASKAESKPGGSKGGTGGGGSGAERPSDADVRSSSLSKQQFVKRANRVCKKARSNMLGRMAVYVEGGMSGKKPQKVLIAEAVKASMLPTLEREIAAVRALGAPQGDEERIGAMLAAQREAIDEVSELESTTLEAVEGHFDEVAEEFTEYGLLYCAV